MTSSPASPCPPETPAPWPSGTSFHGFFETTDGGRKWVSLSEPLTPLKLGGGNYEEIASLAYEPDAPDRIWFSLGFGKGLFAYHEGREDGGPGRSSAGPGQLSRALDFLQPAQPRGGMVPGGAN